MYRRILLATIALAAFGSPVAAQEAPASDAIFFALQDVSLIVDSVQLRTAHASEMGGSALLQLEDGTLVDVRLAAGQDGWAVRNIALVAGSADAFRGWSQPWRDRVRAAENFIASANSLGTRTAEELAPLTWFEDPDQSTRLWGMNPITYRMMQTLQMMPQLSGPTGGGTPGNPVPRR